MSGTNTRYLRRIGQSWYVSVKVPPSLQKLAKNTHIRKALGTRDLDRANALKWAHVKAIKAELERLRRGPVPAGAADPYVDEAKKYRTALIEARAVGEDEHVEIMEEHAVDRAREIEKETGSEQRGFAWFDLATASTPTLAELLETWLESEAHYKEATKSQHRAALDSLKGFVGGDRLPAAINDDAAIAYVDDYLKKSGQAYNTQRRKLNSLVRFWKWMGMRKHVPRGFNPWKGFELSKKRTQKATPDKRAYTEAELMLLFAEQPGYEGLGDAMVLGLYTGARIEELCALRMQDAERRQGVFFLTLRTDKGKTQTRTIAVAHRHAVAVLMRRWNPKSKPEAQLFPEFKPGGYDGKLSWAVSKAFGRFRDARGLPRAVDFHSFRRTLITLLENASADQVRIARYVGHAIDTLAATTYSQGSTEQTNKEVARLIKFPAKVERAVEAFLGDTEATRKAA